MQQKVLLLLISLLIVTQATQKPVIGIFMQESVYPEAGYPSSNWSYIAASYVKYLEMGGAQVVPLHYDGDHEYYDNMFNQLNGIFFAGGSQDIEKETKYGQNAMYVFQKAKQANDNGTYFPLWGTCNGFQLIATLVNDFAEVLTHIDHDEHANHTVQIQDPATMFGNMPELLQQNIQEYEIAFYNHQWAISLKTWEENQKLQDFLTLTGISENDLGDKFVASYQAKDYPFFAVQFHPEKSIFEWKLKENQTEPNHTQKAIQNSQYFGNFYIQQTRQNDHQFKSEAELQDLLIYNYKAVQVPSSSFEQVYFFRNFDDSTVLK